MIGSRGRRGLSARAAALAAAVGLALVAALAGCGDTTAAPGSSTPAPAPEESSETGFDPLADPEQVPLLARAELGESPEMRRIYLSHTSVSLQVRDPDKPENLDDYIYSRGTWTTRPVSVSVHEIEEFDAVTFTLGAVNWKAIPGLMQQALDGLDLEGEEITGVSIDRIAGDPPRIYIGVNGLRGSGRLIANADGTNADVQRS